MFCLKSQDETKLAKHHNLFHSHLPYLGMHSSHHRCRAYTVSLDSPVAEKRAKLRDKCLTSSCSILMRADKEYEETNFIKSLPLYQRVARTTPDLHEKGWALFRLATAFYLGRGTTKDLIRAAEAGAAAYRLLIDAAEDGDAKSLYAIAWLVFHGTGVSQNKKEAAKLYEAAAKEGFSLGYVNLAAMYCRGDGNLPVNRDEAIRLLKIAVEKGNAVAMVHLGIKYFHGHDCNLKEAVRLLKLASEHGNSCANVRLAKMYETGTGVNINIPEAARLYRQAGNSSAYFPLARMYYNGEGVSINRKEALRLMQLAANHGNEEARRFLQEESSLASR